MEVERIQAIASKTLDTIPTEFIRSELEQPAITTAHGSVLEVPTIDLGKGDQDGELVGLISRASSEWGLFQVVNHGIPREVIQNLQKVGKEFFELPQQEKEVYAKPLGFNGDEGYGTNLQKELEGKKGWVDHLFHNIWPPSAINYRFWPSNPPSYRKANEEYAEELRGVTEKLLKWLSKGLGIREEAIIEGVGGEEMKYLLKINYYPPCPRPDLALGVVAHTDMSLITILVPNQVPGLQVFRDGLWYNVNYIPNALLIHIGDQLQIMSNGKYKAVLHRTTVNKDRSRMSWPVFIEPPSDHIVGPIPELINEQNPAMYKAKKYADYKYCKLNKLPQ